MICTLNIMMRRKEWILSQAVLKKICRIQLMTIFKPNLLLKKHFKANLSHRNLSMSSSELAREYFLMPLPLRFNRNSKLIAKIYYFNDKQDAINLIGTLEIILISKDTKEMFLILISNNCQLQWLPLQYKNAN